MDRKGSAVDKLAVLHILQRNVRRSFRTLGCGGGAELRACGADLFQRLGNRLLRLAEGVVSLAACRARQRAGGMRFARLRRQHVIEARPLLAELHIGYHPAQLFMPGPCRLL